MSQTIVLAAKLVRQTERAYLLDFDGDQRWVPKSQATLIPAQKGLPPVPKVELSYRKYLELFPNDPH